MGRRINEHLYKMITFNCPIEIANDIDALCIKLKRTRTDVLNELLTRVVVNNRDIIGESLKKNPYEGLNPKITQDYLDTLNKEKEERRNQKFKFDEHGDLILDD